LTRTTCVDELEHARAEICDMKSMQENGDSTTRTVPLDRSLYHCSLCGKNGHEEIFCYRRARKMW
jgi:hypothetical protein